MQGFALDADRLAQLRVFTDAERHAIAKEASTAITNQLDRLDHALASSDLGAAAEAAHLARNETLLVGASSLTNALADFERAARAGEPEQARAAVRDVKAVWPATQAAINDIAAGG